MTKQFLKAIRIGNYVEHSLKEINSGKVIGATSKGVFFLFGHNSLFLTRAQGLSPFNIVIPEEDQIPENLNTGDEVIYSLGDLLIPNRQVTIALAEAEVWTPPVPEMPRYQADEKKPELMELVAELKKVSPEKGFLFLIEEESALTEEQRTIKRHVADFKQAYFQHNVEACLNVAGLLFGLGGGLTPSGDDVITGFQLYQVRVRALQNESERAFIDEIGKRLTELAYQKTTYVSANRLEAACRGWSEELFLNVLNLISGFSRLEISRLARELASFGHSSGIDTTLGIEVSTRII